MYSALIYVGLLVSATLAVPSQELTDDLQNSELKRLFGVKDLIDAPEYEIVYPQVLTSDGNYDINTEAIAEDSLNINIEAFGETLLLTVHQDSSSFSPNFYAEEISGDGKPPVPIPVRLDCLYNGKVASEPNSRVSLSTSSGLTAVIFHAKGPTSIEPMGNDLITNRGRPHVAYKQRDWSGVKCGVTDKHRVTKKSPFQTFQGTQSTKTMELAIFTDDEAYNQKGGNTAAGVNTVFNAVKGFLEDSTLGDTLKIKCQSVHIYKNNGPGLTNDLETSLDVAGADQFAKNVNSDANSNHWDNALYLTGHTSPSLLGIAYVGVCDTSQYSVALTSWTTLSTTVEVAAHELGHNLGMQHDSDGNICPASGYIMASVGLGFTTWSACSKTYMDSNLQSTTCYDD